MLAVELGAGFGGDRSAAAVQEGGGLAAVGRQCVDAFAIVAAHRHQAELRDVVLRREVGGVEVVVEAERRRGERGHERCEDLHATSP